MFYHLDEFIDHYVLDEDGTKGYEVAVIPDPWLVGGSLCKWPPTGGDASWVTRGKQPEASWKTFGIKMLKSSSKLLLCFMVKYN